MRRRTLSPAVSVILVILVIGGTLLLTHSATVKASNVAVTGWAWSDNIGWVSLNCQTDPTGCRGPAGNWGLSVSSGGVLSGYAWSTNVGWISFNDGSQGGTNDLTGCPAGTCSAYTSGTAIRGWAKVLSAGGGWDGWISLNCLDPNVCNIPPTQQLIVLTSGSSWTVPSDWNNANNTIEVIGGGGGGASATVSNDTAGGGGGAYAKVQNISLTPGSPVAYSIGLGGAPDTGGGDTFFCNSTSNCASIAGTAVQVGAKGGSGAQGTKNGGPGGAAVSSVGTTKNSGGAGGTTQNFQNGGSGGGGAGGPFGAGAAGGVGGVGSSGTTASGGAGGGGADNGSVGINSSGTVSSGSAGGAGQDGTSGGTGGAANTAGNPGSHGSGGGGGGNTSSATAAGAGGAGGAGVEWGSYGAGGGGAGGGGRYSTSGTGNGGIGGSGGLYGGGGGGGGWTSSGTLGVGGAGAQGIIIITYTPAAGSSSYAVTYNSGIIGGYAWGNEGTGWLQFNGNYVCTPTWVCSANQLNDTSCGSAPQSCPNGCTNGAGSCNVLNPPGGSSAYFYAQPARVRSGATTTLLWAIQGATSCNISGATSAGPNGDSWSNVNIPTSTQVTSGITAATRYTMSCTGPGGSMSTTTLINITPGFQEL